MLAFIFTDVFIYLICYPVWVNLPSLILFFPLADALLSFCGLWLRILGCLFCMDFPPPPAPALVCTLTLHPRPLSCKNTLFILLWSDSPFWPVPPPWLVEDPWTRKYSLGSVYLWHWLTMEYLKSHPSLNPVISHLNYSLPTGLCSLPRPPSNLVSKQNVTKSLQ